MLCHLSGLPMAQVQDIYSGNSLALGLGRFMSLVITSIAIDIVEGEKGRRTLKTGSLFATYAVSKHVPARA